MHKWSETQSIFLREGVKNGYLTVRLTIKGGVSPLSPDLKPKNVLRIFYSQAGRKR